MFNKSTESAERIEIIAFNCEEFAGNNFGSEKGTKNVGSVRQKLLSSDC